MKKWSIYCSIVLFLGSCALEEDTVGADPDPILRSSSEVMLKITFEDAGGAPFTRAVTATDENKIQTLDVLIFTSGGTANQLDDKFAYRLSAVAGAGSADVKDLGSSLNGQTKTVTLPLKSLAAGQRIVLLANLPSDLRTNVIGELGDEDEGLITAREILPQLKFISAPWRGNAETATFTPIPMFGERTDYIAVHYGATHPTDGYEVNMTRALAKINVGVNVNNNSAVQNTVYGTFFVIDSVFVCNSSDSAYVSAHNGMTSKRTTEDIGYRFPSGNSSPITLQNSIYVPGSDPSISTSRPAFLVIKAKYDKSGTNLSSAPYRYYRIDFIDDGDYLPLERNHEYTINILTIKTEGYATLQEAKAAPLSTLNFDVSIEGANSDINDISVYENQYLLGISVNEVVFDWEGNHIGHSDNFSNDNGFLLRVYSTYNNNDWSVEPAPAGFTVTKASNNTALRIKPNGENLTGAEKAPATIRLKSGLLTKEITVRWLGGANSAVLKFGSSNTASVRLPLAFVEGARGASIFNGKQIIDFKDSVIWQEKGSDVTFTASLSAGSPVKEQYITVTATASGADEKYKYGNAVVALMWVKPDAIAMVGGDLPYEVVWSWHIWAMPSDGNVSANYHDPNRLLLMDRVLGKSFSADQPNHKGLYYQWGRKDPFYHTESNQDAYRPDNFDYTETVLASNLTNAILYPTTFFRGAASSYDWLTSPQDGLWNPTMGSQTKSYYDPCPEGWRVPPSYYTDIDFSPWLHEGGYVAERNSTGFIPSAMGEADLQSATYLWTSSVNGAHAVYVGGSSSGGYTHYQRMYRAAALSVRCVKDLARQY